MVISLQGEVLVFGTEAAILALNRRVNLSGRAHDTVHSFQSVEYLCIIFDTTEVSIKQFTSNTWGRDGISHDATRLPNVAHSRARDKLIYLAKVDYITEQYLPAAKRYRQNHLLTHIINSICQQERVASQHLNSI